jgi:hypothetical protein
MIFWPGLQWDVALWAVGEMKHAPSVDGAIMSKGET